MKTQLLCTFSQINDYRTVINKITNFYKIVFGKVYVLQNKDDVDELMLTYNINADVCTQSSFLPDTISVHRKKDSNTLYTINSLNELIRKLNNGMLDTSYSVNWNDYKNTILLTDSDKGVRLIPTKLHEIIKI